MYREIILGTATALTRADLHAGAALHADGAYVPVGSAHVKQERRVVHRPSTAIIHSMPSAISAVSIIVPTYREAPNIRTLIERIFTAVARAGSDAELILVDDNSQDGTEAIVEELRADYSVRLIVRKDDRGLSSAVVCGFRDAKYDRLVVLDADLQHPPEMIPALLKHLDEEDCDFVIGTRYGADGAIAEHWPLRRRLGSRFATLLARPLVPLSDPLSGFFALHRETWLRAEALDPIGYKIGLELYVKCRCKHPAEVPIRFEARTAGESKLTFREQVRYMRHLGRLYRFRFPWLTWVLGVGVLAGAALAVLFVTSALR